MSDLIQKLRDRGCDIDGAMGRFLDDEEFYGQCYEQVMEDVNFSRLKETLDAENVTEAFEAAHSLKGVIANMGLTPLYDKIVEIVEPLRAGSCEGLSVYCDQLLALKEEYTKLM